MSHVCAYCGKPAKFKLSHGRWCCSETQQKCNKNKINPNLIKDLNQIVWNPNIGHKTKIIENPDNSILCDYGCNKPAKYIQISNGKFCCENSRNKCPYLIEKSAQAKRGKKRSVLATFKRRYPHLFEVEKIIEDSDKNIWVECKYCGLAYKIKSDREVLYYRQQAIKTGVGSSYFYCSEKCRSMLYGYDEEIVGKWKFYFLKVWKETQKTLKTHNDKIKNLNLRGFEFPLDHKYSVYAGFQNDIDPKIIGHWKNLEIITQSENASKKTKCSITIEQLLKEIESTKEISSNYSQQYEQI
jgi:hypothetical protein